MSVRPCSVRWLAPRHMRAGIQQLDLSWSGVGSVCVVLATTAVWPPPLPLRCVAAEPRRLLIVVTFSPSPRKPPHGTHATPQKKKKSYLLQTRLAGLFFLFFHPDLPLTPLLARPRKEVVRALHLVENGSIGIGPDLVVVGHFEHLARGRYASAITERDLCSDRWKHRDREEYRKAGICSGHKDAGAQCREQPSSTKQTTQKTNGSLAVKWQMGTETHLQEPWSGGNAPSCSSGAACVTSLRQSAAALAQKGESLLSTPP